MSESQNLSKQQMLWVLLSASADQKVSETCQINDIKLLKTRHQNKTDPSQLVQEGLGSLKSYRKSNTAVLIAGELRCLERSKQLMEELAIKCDLFIVTSKKYSRRAHQLTEDSMIRIIDDKNEAAQTEKKIPHNAMIQWHRLKTALEMASEEEKKRGKKYASMIKVRTDYYYAHPRRMIRRINTQLKKADSGMIGASDKTFAASRDNMMLLKAFTNLLVPFFYNKQGEYLPINIQQVLKSDVSCKWYGMNWPVDLVGRPETIDDLKDLLRNKQEILTTSFSDFQAKDSSEYITFFKGDSKFASEISFANFLNLVGIPFNDCKSLRGFLYEDRKKCK